MSKLTINVKENSFTILTGETFKLADMGLKRKPKETDASMVKRLVEEIPRLLDNIELPQVKGKVTTIIKCTEKGCELYRKIYTSDKHQVKFCRLHQRRNRGRQTTAYRKQTASTKKPVVKKKSAKQSTKKSKSNKK